LYLVFGQKVFLQKPGVLRPAEVGKRLQQKLAHRRAGPRWSHPGAGCAPQLADQPVAPVIKPLQHSHLCNQVSDRHRFVAHIVRQLMLETQSFLQGRDELISDRGRIHNTHATWKSMYYKHGRIPLGI
jgi:hypothetical protein